MDTPIQSVPPTPVPTSPKKNTMTIAVVVILLVVAAAAAFFFLQYPSLQATAEVKSLEKAFNANDLNSSLVKADALLAKYPNNADILTMKALALAQKGSLEFREKDFGPQAVTVANQAITADPNSSEAHRALAYAYEIQQNYAKAHEEYQKALALDATNVYAIFGDAHCYDLQGDAVKAEAGYKAAVAADPTFGKAHSGLARSLVKSGNIDGAIAEYDLAYKNTINNREKAEAAYSTGMLLLYKKENTNARPYFEDATKIDAGYSLGWYGLGSGLFSEATDPKTTLTAKERATLIITSFDALNKAITINPNQSLAYMQIALQLTFTGEADKALSVLAKAAVAVPNDITLGTNDKVAVLERIHTSEKSIQAGIQKKKK